MHASKGTFLPPPAFLAKPLLAKGGPRIVAKKNSKKTSPFFSFSLQTHKEQPRNHYPSISPAPLALEACLECAPLGPGLLAELEATSRALFLSLEGDTAALVLGFGMSAPLSLPGALFDFILGNTTLFWCQNWRFFAAVTKFNR